MFVLLMGPDKKRLLLNLDQTLCIQEGQQGEAIAVSLQGTQVATGEKFETVMNEMLAEEEGPQS